MVVYDRLFWFSPSLKSIDTNYQKIVDGGHDVSMVLQGRKKEEKNVNKIAMTNHIQCAQWGTIFLKPMNTNAIVLGMKQHCDMKILHYEGYAKYIFKLEAHMSM
jgi:hypothetical protein